MVISLRWYLSSRAILFSTSSHHFILLRFSIMYVSYLDEEGKKPLSKVIRFWWLKASPGEKKRCQTGTDGALGGCAQAGVTFPGLLCPNGEDVRGTLAVFTESLMWGLWEWGEEWLESDKGAFFSCWKSEWESPQGSDRLKVLGAPRDGAGARN